MTSELRLSCYNVYRKDQNEVGGDDRRGGGVLITIKKDLISTPVHWYIGFEALAIEVHGTGSSFLVIVCYLPPGMSSALFQDFIDSVDILCAAHPRCKQLIYGDFNLSGILWSVNDLAFSTIGYVPPDRLSAASYIRGVLSGLGLVQHLQPYLDRPYQLDLLFAPPNYVTTTDVNEELVPVDPFHGYYYFSITPPVSVPSLNPFPLLRNFKSCDYDTINGCINSVDWPVLFGDLSVDDCVEKFYGVINGIIESHVDLVPLRVFTSPPWFTAELSELVRLKSGLHAAWRCYGALSDYIEFKRVRAHCRRLYRSLFRGYVDHAEESLSSDCSSFWRYVKATSRSGSLPSSMYLDSALADSPSDVAELFAKHFGAVYQSSTDPLSCSSSLTLSSSSSLSTRHSRPSATPHSISTAISKLKLSSHPGPDSIPTLFLVKCSSFI